MKRHNLSHSSGGPVRCAGGRRQTGMDGSKAV
jgi:hypothetical protein